MEWNTCQRISEYARITSTTLPRGRALFPVMFKNVFLQIETKEVGYEKEWLYFLVFLMELAKENFPDDHLAHFLWRVFKKGIWNV